MMFARALALILQLAGVTVTAAWDPNTDSTTGYQVLYGPMAGTEATTVDVGNVTSARLVLAPGPYFFVVKAYNALGKVSGPSNEVSYQVVPAADPRCLFPGDRSVLIFVTGKLVAGSGGPGSQTRIDYNLGSPNSPVTHVAIVDAGLEITKGGDGLDVSAFGAIWFVIPKASGVHVFNITARNDYGCTATVPANHSVVVP